MKKSALLIISVFYCISLSAQTYKKIMNQFTGKWDYVVDYNTLKNEAIEGAKDTFYIQYDCLTAQQGGMVVNNDTIVIDTCFTGSTAGGPDSIFIQYDCGTPQSNGWVHLGETIVIDTCPPQQDTSYFNLIGDTAITNKSRHPVIFDSSFYLTHPRPEQRVGYLLAWESTTGNVHPTTVAALKDTLIIEGIGDNMGDQRADSNLHMENYNIEGTDTAKASYVMINTNYAYGERLYVFGDATVKGGLFFADDLEVGDSATVGGDLFVGGSLNVSGSIKYNFSTIANNTFIGQKVYAQAGVNLDTFDVCYKSGSDNKLYIADADNTTKMIARFMSCDTVSANNWGWFLVYGWVRNDAWSSWTVSPTGYIYVKVGGGLTQTAPSGADDVIQVVGVPEDTKIIHFDPQIQTIELY